MPFRIRVSSTGFGKKYIMERCQLRNVEFIDRRVKYDLAATAGREIGACRLKPHLRAVVVAAVSGRRT